jgi:hypothetical protein
MSDVQVAPRPAGAGTHNTLVLGVVDLEIPLEADLDDDPGSPDTLRLRKQDGGYEAVLRGDHPDVQPDGDSPLLLYCFKAVPLGIYDLELETEDGWLTVIDELVVTGETVMRGDSVFLDDGFSGSDLGEPDDEWEDEADEDEEEDDDFDEDEEDEEDGDIGHDDDVYGRDED